MRQKFVLSLVLLTALSNVTRAQEAEEEAPESPSKVPVSGIEFPLVTRGEGEFNGKQVAWTATVGALEVEDAEGQSGASIVSTAYVADGFDAASRPVIFLWNGGPISPSVYLHMGSIGPKRVAFPDDLSADPNEAPLVDNPYCILDAADLVFFDPAGTGFSRALPGKDLKDYFSVAADAQQTAAYIAAWLESNGRTQSPTYILGESYGTNRAVEVARRLAELEEPVLLDGVVLFGQAVNIIEYAQRPHNIMSYVVSLPTLAAIGYYHGLALTGGLDFDSFVAASWDYASGDYLDALFLGNALSPERMAAVAAQLEGFSGLDAQVFMDNRLRVSKELYRVELLKNNEQVIGRADGRYVGPARVEGAEEGAPPPDPSGPLPQRLAEVFQDYLVSDLRAPSAEQYVIGSPVRGLNDWEWAGQTPFSRFDYGDGLQVLFDKHPAARVEVWAGYYDTMTTTGASKYLVDQETWPRQQVRLRFYQGGHMAYSVEDSARQMAQDLRTLVQDQ
jgi:carboxypeptidase C (cathepsin A)